MNDGLLGPRKTFLSLPQGSILSPILYIMCTSDLENKVINTKPISYADNICLNIITNKKRHHLLSQQMSIFDQRKNVLGLNI